MTKTPSARTARPLIGLLSALLVAMIPQSAIALEYCRRDSSSDMWNCSYETMEQCDDGASGRGGYCRRDPFLPAPAPAHLHHATARPLPRPMRARQTTPIARVAISLHM
ncbi:DUF3551 domain-containing protein [Bradyrhizobium sp. Pa8]|uniref:DUF3551 domain-containing protein n=1 Tax=Bradyrhizobium sp. Pa8 TaxID=3386552 RepID=UPI00403F6948